MESTIGRLRTASWVRRIARPEALRAVASAARGRRRFLAMSRHCPHCRRERWFEYRARPNGTGAGAAEEVLPAWQCPICNRPS